MHRKKERILKAVGGKHQVTFKSRPSKNTPDFSIKTLKARRIWRDICKLQKTVDYYIKQNYQLLPG